MLSRLNRRSIAPLIIMLSMLLTLVVAAPVAAKKNPAGNNGTVKIDRMPFDDHPNNQPHVGCRFQLDFYGFDADPSYFAEVIFELHSPTAAGRSMTVRSGDLHPFIGEDDNGGGGSEAGLDASETYTLDFTGAPHAKQGYHVKLTVHAPGSQGADTKHKVFWVQPCVRNDPPGNPPNDPSGNPPNNPPNNPPANPPHDPPGGGADGGSGTPREDTASGGIGPGMLLPDTAMDPATKSPALIAGAMLLGGTMTFGTVAIRRQRSRRS